MATGIHDLRGVPLWLLSLSRGCGGAKQPEAGAPRATEFRDTRPTSSRVCCVHWL